MARVFHNNEWYDELGPGSLFEADFERILLQNLRSMCPGYAAVPFKKTVSSAYGTARADLALIQDNYLAWWIVEVELATHSLTGHVLPQVQKLVDAAYGRSEADYMASKSDALDRGKLHDMVRGEPPRVLVVANAPSDEWEQRLWKRGARLAVFQLFRSLRGIHLVLADGFWPTAGREVRSRCYVHSVIGKFLVVGKPAILPASTVNGIPIYYRGKLTVWRRVETADQVRIMPLVNVTLDPNAEYELIGTATSLRLERLT